MKLKLAVYNMEWMKNLFFKDGTPKGDNALDSEDRKDAERKQAARQSSEGHQSRPALHCRWT